MAICDKRTCSLILGQMAEMVRRYSTEGYPAMPSRQQGTFAQ